MVLRFGDDTASHNRGGDRQRRGSQARSPGQRRLVRQMGAGHGVVRPPLPKPSATMAQQAQRTAGEREELFRVVYRQASRKRSSQDYNRRLLHFAPAPVFHYNPRTCFLWPRIENSAYSSFLLLLNLLIEFTSEIFVLQKHTQKNIIGVYLPGLYSSNNLTQ